MYSYVLRRIMLMVPTFIGISLIFFVILQLAPGGPLEQELMRYRMSQATAEGGSSGGSRYVNQDISPQALEQLKRFYGFDKPLLQRYLLWLGLWPRRMHEKVVEPGDAFRQRIRFETYENDRYEVQKWIRVTVSTDGGLEFHESAVGADFAFGDYVELPDAARIKNWYPVGGWKYEPVGDGSYRVFRTAFSGILQGNLGTSYTFRRPVGSIIVEKLHISAYFGLTGFLIAYIVSIPLGITKAVKHRSLMDTASSVLVFVGYSIPGFAVGLLLLMLLASSSFLDIFPLGGFRSLEWETLSFWGKVWDQIHHTILPIIAWSLGSFATLTILTKNSLIENLGQDYVRTAFAKGLSEHRVIFVHALRNSLIPLATNIGGIIGIIFAGSYLIEKTFNINGIGLLGLNSLIRRDYPISLAFMVISTIIGVTGNLISDISYALIDPRIRFR